ncbi:DUF2281 domain-containing protein [Crocosphaera sp. XPORK-15E]|uniref:DUF2281 domain-containing protein n=1 Tax=Crocosphaera sp. XPORK-15E TaxID=3110247 RepID=UPI002B207A89|nr:DUF2281 domain-containing protein [Crocosphaera sp. XPORK-15E]MEA5535092.1 DUF2281 domain-containing protein [Crocosphaera sp. XPORK-15E]
MTIVEIASAKLLELPLDKQQEVLDFIEFLQSKIEPEKIEEPVSFLEAAKEFAGCLDSNITDTSHENDPLKPFIGIIDTKGSDWVKNEEITNKKGLAGSMKGTFVLPLSEDFDEPLEDFEDYM